MKIKSSRRLVARLGLALAVAAIAAPTAQAMPMNEVSDSGGNGNVRHYADDMHASLPLVTLKASNVQTDAASPQPPDPAANVVNDVVSPQSVDPAANVLTDSASFQGQPVSNPGANVLTDSASFHGQPISNPGANVQTDSASPSRPVGSLVGDFVDVRTDAASSVPTTDAEHTALLRHRAQLGQEYAELASTPLPSTDSPGIDWSVATIGAALGALGLMFLIGIVYYAGRHNRSRLAAT